LEKRSRSKLEKKSRSKLEKKSRSKLEKKSRSKLEKKSRLKAEKKSRSKLEKKSRSKLEKKSRLKAEKKSRGSRQVRDRGSQGALQRKPTGEIAAGALSEAAELGNTPELVAKVAYLEKENKQQMAKNDQQMAQITELETEIQRLKAGHKDTYESSGSHHANVAQISDAQFRILKKDFDAFDQNHSGFINVGPEFQNFLEKQMGRPVSEDEADEYLKSTDTDTDGMISFDEYMASLFAHGYTVI